MATIITEAINADFAFADNPIIVKATGLNFETGSIFRQVIFEVFTFYNGGASTERSFTFAVNVDDGATSVECDISSALRSTFAQYKYNADAVTSTGTITYPFVTYVMSIKTREMIDGVVKDSAPTYQPPLNEDKEYTGAYKSFLGGLSDMERWSGGETKNAAIPSSFSTKPTGEIRDRGQLIATSTYDATNRVVKTQFSTAQSGTLDTRDRTTILFVNSRGVFDTISVVGYESEEYAVSAEVRSLVGGASYRPSPYVTTHKEGGGASWKMSSGWVNREWAQWFAREFLMAKHYWIPKDGRWLPVAITPDSDSIVTYDKNDPSLLAVNFTATAAIKG